MLTITLNPALDMSTSIEVVEPDRKMHCVGLALHPGGGGINVARVAARLDCEVTAAAFVSVASSERLVSMLAPEGVALEIIPIEGQLRESLTVVETSTARQYRFVLPGPAMDRDHLDAGIVAAVALARDQSLVVVSGSLPPGVTPDDLAGLVGRLREGGAEVIVDTGGTALAAVARIGVLLIKPSARELSDFAEAELTGHPELEAAARRLLALGPNRAALVSLGEAGALLVRPEEVSLWFHAPRVRAVSTVGAGDSLVGGLASALGKGATMEDATRFGVAAGTAATLSTGTGLCRPADVDRLLAEVLVTPLGG